MQLHGQLECFMSISLLAALRTIKEITEISKVQELSRFDIKVARSEEEQRAHIYISKPGNIGQLNI